MKVDAYGILERTRNEKPLVHHITNWVTIYDCANIVRTIGALPVMAHAKEEVQEMTSIAGALVINIGTLTPELVDSMILAAKKSNELNHPVVMDAVGVGATKLRTESAKRILDEVHVDVLKGNSAEIGTLAGVEAETKGVEAISVEGDPKELAKTLAAGIGNTVTITGKQDVVSNGSKTYLINNGHDMMGSIVGTGCMVASVMGAFTAVESDYTKACSAALACFGIAGELAAEKAKGPGTYKELFYDAIYNLDREKIQKLQKIDMI